MPLLFCSFDEDTALTCGKAIAGMFAQSKGRAIGVFEPKGKDPEVRHNAVISPAAQHRTSRRLSMLQTSAVLES